MGDASLEPPDDPHASARMRWKLAALGGLAAALVVVGRTLVDVPPPSPAPTPTQRPTPPPPPAPTDLPDDGSKPIGDGPYPPGTLVRVASTEPDAMTLAVFGGAVYWTQRATGAVMKAPLSGGPPVLLATEPGGAYSVAVDASGVYWLGGTGTVMALPHPERDGAAPAARLLARTRLETHGLAVDEHAVYWTNESRGRVSMVPKSGGRRAIVASGQEEPLDLATDGDLLCWANARSGTIVCAWTAGGEPFTIASGQRRPHAVAIEGAYVYWTMDDAVMRAPWSGGPAETVIARKGMGWALSLDVFGLYAAASDEGLVLRSDPEGGAAGKAPDVIAERQALPRPIAADGRAVYWADEASGHIVMRAHPAP